MALYWRQLDSLTDSLRHAACLSVAVGDPAALTVSQTGRCTVAVKMIVDGDRHVCLMSRSRVCLGHDENCTSDLLER